MKAVRTREAERVAVVMMVLVMFSSPLWLLSILFTFDKPTLLYARRDTKATLCHLPNPPVPAYPIHHSAHVGPRICPFSIPWHNNQLTLALYPTCGLVDRWIEKPTENYGLQPYAYRQS